MHSTAQHIVAQCKTQRSTAQRNATLSETQRIVLSILYMMCFFADGSDHATSVPMPLFLQADGGDRTFSFFIGSVLLAGSLGAKTHNEKTKRQEEALRDFDGYDCASEMLNLPRQIRYDNLGTTIRNCWLLFA